MTGPASAASLLGTPIVALPLRPEIDLPPELLADLNDPRLIITPDYIGIDRRRSGGWPKCVARAPKVGLRMRQIVVTALITTTAVIPLTLVATGALAQAHIAHTTPQALPSTTSQRPVPSTERRVSRAQRRQAAAAAGTEQRVSRAQRRQAAAAAGTEQRVSRAQRR